VPKPDEAGTADFKGEFWAGEEMGKPKRKGSDGPKRNKSRQHPRKSMPRKQPAIQSQSNGYC